MLENINSLPIAIKNPDYTYLKMNKLSTSDLKKLLPKPVKSSDYKFYEKRNIESSFRPRIIFDHLETPENNPTISLKDQKQKQLTLLNNKIKLLFRFNPRYSEFKEITFNTPEIQSLDNKIRSTATSKAQNFYFTIKKFLTHY